MHPHLRRCVISSQDEPAAARCVGRSSDCADTYLIDSGTPTLPRFPGLEDPVPLRHFVSAYRCGAVPDLHRIPFSSHSGSWSNYRHADYIVFRPSSNHYLWCFFGSCGSNAWRGLRSVWVQSAPPTPPSLTCARRPMQLAVAAGTAANLIISQNSLSSINTKTGKQPLGLPILQIKCILKSAARKRRRSFSCFSFDSSPRLPHKAFRPI